MDGQILEPTYIKRARQLVKNGRAEWVSEDAIRLRRYSEEVNILEPITNITPTADTAAADPNPGVNAPDRSDGIIMDLAKRRMAARRALVGQALDFLLILIFAFCFISTSRYSGYLSTAVLLSLIFCLFFGIRLLYRVIKFARPSFRGGFREYLRKRKEQKLAFEYDRIKKMGAEYVASELSGK